MIHVIAVIELNAGTRDAFLQEFHKIVPLVLAEEGCLEYGPAVDEPTDLTAQSPIRPDVVTILEKWESVGHLKVHLAAPHMVEYRPKVRDYVKNTILQVLSPA
ncbi:MAG: putative quinol monooxygenase [Isosphaeraceae bacterium]